MNKQQYEQAHREAEHLHGRIRDLIDDASHHLGRELLDHAHRLVQDIRSQKNPRSLEANVRNVLNALQNIRGNGDSVMDFRHTDMFIASYQNLAYSFRKFDNY